MLLLQWSDDVQGCHCQCCCCSGLMMFRGSLSVLLLQWSDDVQGVTVSVVVAVI